MAEACREAKQNGNEVTLVALKESATDFPFQEGNLVLNCQILVTRTHGDFKCLNLAA